MFHSSLQKIKRYKKDINSAAHCLEGALKGTLASKKTDPKGKLDPVLVKERQNMWDT